MRESTSMPETKLNRQQRRAAQKAAHSKRTPRPQRWHQQHTAWDLATASPDKPMPPERYTTHMTRMQLALDAIARDADPNPDDWRSVADAINLVDTLVQQGHAQDADGLLKDALDAMQAAWQRSERTGQPMRLDGPGLTACRAILIDWRACLEQLPERTIIAAHIATERRLRAILARATNIKTLTQQGGVVMAEA